MHIPELLTANWLPQLEKALYRDFQLLFWCIFKTAASETLQYQQSSDVRDTCDIVRTHQSSRRNPAKLSFTYTRKSSLNFFNFSLIETDINFVVMHAGCMNRIRNWPQRHLKEVLKGRVKKR